jgi:hypothetical protein
VPGRRLFGRASRLGRAWAGLVSRFGLRGARRIRKYLGIFLPVLLFMALGLVMGDLEGWDVVDSL